MHPQLANVFGDDAQSFTATWYLADGTVVHAEPYESLWQMALDEGDSRVWAAFTSGSSWLRAK